MTAAVRAFLACVAVLLTLAGEPVGASTLDSPAAGAALVNRLFA